MAELSELLDAAIEQGTDAAFEAASNSRKCKPDLAPALDVAIGMTGADMGTLQRFVESEDCLELVASCGFSSEAQSFFNVVHRDTNTTCAAALMRRMRVFVEDVSTSYLFVGTSELGVLQAEGIVAGQSTPLISSNGRFWGVLSTHFRRTQMESEFDHAPLDRLAAQIADSLERRTMPAEQHGDTKSDRED